MRQERVCHLFGWTCPHIRAFLSLPKDVRKLIYIHAGAVPDYSPILGILPYEPYLSNRDPPWGNAITLSLFLTCRAIYEELRPVVWSAAQFQIIQENPEDNLSVLRSLRPATAMHLTDLYVQLVNYSGNCLREDTRRRTNLCQQTLAPVQQGCFDFMGEWQTGIINVLTSVKAGQLRLCLIYYTRIFEEAAAALQPLIDMPNHLRKCLIKFESGTDKRLKKLAKDVATRAIYSSPQSCCKPFRFLDLPVEVRQMILAYSDLIPPNGQIMWEGGIGFHRCFSIPGYRYRCHCNTSSTAKPENYDDYIDPADFCPLLHNAYTTSCSCFASPARIFLVCRTVYTDAQVVFFSQTRFVLEPVSSVANWPNSVTHVGKHYPFFRNGIRVPMIRMLRKLDFLFRPFSDSQYMSDKGERSKQWLTCIDDLRAHANLPLLTISIYLSRHNLTGKDCSTSINPLEQESIVNWFDAVSESHIFVRRNYNRITAPLSALEGLGRLFVHISPLWHLDPGFERSEKRIKSQLVIDPPRWWSEKSYRWEKKRIAVQEELERSVMGADYDSNALGKVDMGACEWAWDFWEYADDPITL